MSELLTGAVGGNESSFLNSLGFPKIESTTYALKAKTIYTNIKKKNRIKLWMFRRSNFHVQLKSGCCVSSAEVIQAFGWAECVSNPPKG